MSTVAFFNPLFLLKTTFKALNHLNYIHGNGWDLRPIETGGTNLFQSPAQRFFNCVNIYSF